MESDVVHLRAPRKAEDNTDAWLMTYADMITLLLSFFVIFVAISEPKQDKLNAIVKEGIGGRFGSVELASPFLGVFRSLQGVVEANNIGREVAVEMATQGIQIEFSSSKFFDDNLADFKTESLPILQELMVAMQQGEYADYLVTVEVHIDNTPVESLIYKSDWELTSARAAKIAQIFVDHGFTPKKLRATGFGASRPKVPNEDMQGNPVPENKERNKRVIIRLAREI